MSNKDLKRLVIFLLLAFGLTWIPWIAFNVILGYSEWFESGHYGILVLLSSFGPALANVLTRKLTNEGWEDSKLHLNLKGNLKYYLIAFVIMSVVGVLSGLQITFTYGSWDFAEISENAPLTAVVNTALGIFASAPLFAFITFGEEFGWRGYMNDKMEPLLGTVGTCIVGGMIWGVWHAPLTLCGHNYGTEQPFVGVLLMCLNCISSGIILMWLTKKTGSVFPACIMHSMNNNGGTLVGNFLVSGVPETLETTLLDELYLLLPQILVGVVFLILMLREKRIEKTGSIC